MSDDIKNTQPPVDSNNDENSRSADLDYSFLPVDQGALPPVEEEKNTSKSEEVTTEDNDASKNNEAPENNAVEVQNEDTANKEAVEAANAVEEAKTGTEEENPTSIEKYHDAPSPAESKAEEGADDDDNDEDEDGEEQGQSIFDHFRELRSRLMRVALSIVVGFGICWFFHNELAAIVYHPLVQVLPADGAKSSSIIFTGVAEGFLTHMKLAIVGGIFLMSPFIFYQLWAFIAPGLYDNEKRFIIPVAISSAVCFIAGGMFCYFIVFPNAFRFFMTYSDGAFQAMPSMKEYFGFTMQLMLAFGIIFEMPLFAFFLAKLGLVTAAAMRRFRRYFIVIAFIIGAFLTPPDPLSQFLMAGPLLLLYELSIIIASIAGKKEKDSEDEDGEDEDDEDESDTTEESEDNPVKKPA